MSVKAKKVTLLDKVNKHKSLIPFVIPAILFALIFCYLPMVGILIAFKDDPNFIRYGFFGALAEADWTLEHFQMIFENPEIFQAVRNTLIISVMKIVILFPLPVILAVMITELRSQKFSKLVQGIVFLPHFFSWVVIVGIFNSIFEVYGPVNNIIEAFGGDSIYFIGNKDWFRWLVVILSGWKEIGYSSIVYIAAIMSIDPSLYEAAKIDGASKLKQIWSITIPSIMPTIIVMLIIRIGYLMDAGFEQVYAMFNANIKETGDIIGTYVYRLATGSESNYGLSTAVGLLNGLISMGLILGANYFSKKKTGSGVW